VENRFYRYEAVEYAVLDANGEAVSPTFPNPKIELREYVLHKETPKGYWIGYDGFSSISSYQKWVSKTAKKRYAYPTKKEALYSFIKRTERRIKILSGQLDSSKYALQKAKNIVIE